MNSNLDLASLESAASIAKAIREWVGERTHPEKYSRVKNLEDVRDFVHTLDLLETVLGRFEISVHLARLALQQYETPDKQGSLGWEFWQIDVEEFLAANLLELCYQISNAWKKIEEYSERDKALAVFRGEYCKPSDVLLARHKATHFVPKHFENHQVAQKYSILRRPYQVRDGRLVKEMAKDTMPRVATLIRASTEEGLIYLSKFQEATVG